MVSVKLYIPVSILYKFIAGRYRPVKVADGPITARCRFIKNASWDVTPTCRTTRNGPKWVKRTAKDWIIQHNHVHILIRVVLFIYMLQYLIYCNAVSEQRVRWQRDRSGWSDHSPSAFSQMAFFAGRASNTIYVENDILTKPSAYLHILHLGPIHLLLNELRTECIVHIFQPLLWENVPSLMFAQRRFKCACASVKSNQRFVFVQWRNVVSLVYPNCAQGRFWSDCANAQSDLNLRWAHLSEDPFSDVVALLMNK